MRHFPLWCCDTTRNITPAAAPHSHPPAPPDDKRKRTERRVVFQGLSAIRKPTAEHQRCSNGLRLIPQPPHHKYIRGHRRRCTMCCWSPGRSCSSGPNVYCHRRVRQRRAAGTSSTEGNTCAYARIPHNAQAGTLSLEHHCITWRSKFRTCLTPSPDSEGIPSFKQPEAPPRPPPSSTRLTLLPYPVHGTASLPPPTPPPGGLGTFTFGGGSAT